MIFSEVPKYNQKNYWRVTLKKKPAKVNLPYYLDMRGREAPEGGYSQCWN